MISPCHCRGTHAYIHRHCLDEYIRHFPDRVCRVCHQKLKIPKTVNEFVFFLWTFVFLTTILMMSHERLRVKIFFLCLIWTVGIYYYAMDLFTRSVPIVVFFLWAVFMPPATFHATVYGLFVFGTIAFVYSLGRWIPAVYLLNLFAGILIAAYVGFLTFAVFVTLDKFVFVVYLMLIYLGWNAVVHGHNPLRLLAD